MTTNNIKRVLINEPIYNGYLPVSSDGRYIAFSSGNQYLPVDTHGERNGITGLDVYVKDLLTDTLQFATITADGLVGTGTSKEPAISADGNTVAFSTFASELGRTPGYQGIVVKNLLTGQLARVDTNSSGSIDDGGAGAPSISASGRYVAFESGGTNLVAGDNNGMQDIFVKDMLTGAIVNASLTAQGLVPNSESRDAALSADGRFVAFTSPAANLSLPTYTDRVYLKDLVSGALTLVASNTVGVASVYYSSSATISADGRYVGFEGGADLMPNPTQYGRFLYVKDMQTGLVQMTSADGNGVPANGYSSYGMQLTADGRFAVFQSDASNLVSGDTNNKHDVFIKDLLTGAIRRLSVNHDGVQGDGTSGSAQISADGSTVSFRSEASNLVAGDDNKAADAFVVNVDKAFLTAWSDRITGSEDADLLAGTSGHDHLIGLGGNDSIDGGAGIDMAVLRGVRSGYTLSLNGNGIVVRDNAGLDDTDTLSNIERLKFSDTTLAFDIAGTAGQAYRMYQAAFNRTPDAAGLGYWIAQMDGGVDLNTVAHLMMGSGEFKAMYGNAPTNAAMVDKFYLNVLHRPGESAGLQYWNGLLDTKALTPAQVLAMISEGSENQAALIGILEQGFGYQPYG